MMDSDLLTVGNFKKLIKPIINRLKGLIDAGGSSSDESISKVLWENPNPYRPLNGLSMPINLDSLKGKYKYIKVFYYMHTQPDTTYTMPLHSCDIVLKELYSRNGIIISGYLMSGEITTRRLYINSGELWGFEEAQVHKGSSWTINNSACLPTLIIAYN